MECGGGAWCQVFSWLIENSHNVELAGYPLAKLLETAFGSGNKLIQFVTDNFKEIVGFSIGAFGIWKWWVYREAILHERLREFITESDARLGTTYQDVVRLISRPDKRTNLRMPAYASELTRVLKRNQWEPVINIDGGTHLVERQLTNAVRTIDNRIEVAQKSLTSLRQQRAAADTIVAAIAASRAARARDPAKAKTLDQEALDAYRRVLQLPGHHKDVVAKEGEALHLLRLGHVNEAKIAFVDLETLANRLTDDRQRAFTKSRAMRSRALILQAEAPSGTQLGWTLLTSANAPIGAMALRAPFQPTRDWDAIEDGDICYAAAFLASNLPYQNKEKHHLSKALECYQRVLDTNSAVSARFSSAKRQLRRAARAGIARVRRAMDNKDYDRGFLFQPKTPAAHVDDNSVKPAQTARSSSTPTKLASASSAAPV